MRLAAILFAALAIAGNAYACKPPSGLPPRPEASTQHDAKVDEWTKTLYAKLAADPDPEIAWTGYVLSAADNNDDADVPEPPPVKSSVTRLLQYLKCGSKGEKEDCRVLLEQWVAAEPDNAFVLAVAIARSEAPLVDEAHGLLARASRYDDYSVALRKLTARIAARYDTTPPQEPAGYVPPSCRFLPDTRPETVISFAMMGPISEMRDRFTYSKTIDANLRLQLAERMLAATGSPLAAIIATQIGKSAATAPIDRDRWCRLEARAEALGEPLGKLVFASNDRMRTLRTQFDRALATRNALDALDAIADKLPPDDRPEPLDEEKIAACIAGKSDED